MNIEQQSSGFRRVLRDCIDLAELQLQLFSVDSQEARSKVTSALILGGVASLMAASTLTVLLFALGFVLHEQAQLSVGISLLITCGVTLLLVGILAFVALRLVRTATAALAETKDEFSENLQWIKATMLEPDTSPRNQIRSESFVDPQASSVRATNRFTSASST